MDIFLNLGLAWASVLIMAILSFKYVTRKLWMRDVKNKTLKKLNIGFRKIHIYLGIALIITGLIHGLNSSVDVLSFNFGSLLFIFSIISGLNYMFRKKLKPWLRYHNAITIIMILLLVIHIVNVGGIRIFSVLFPTTQQEAIDNNNTNNNTTDNTNDNTNVGNNDCTDDDDDEYEDDDDDDCNNNTTTNPTPTPGNTNNFGANVVLKDGTFSGNGSGFRGTITVSTTIKDNKVTNISITSIRDDYKYYNRAQSYILPYIVNNQTVTVDTVSGATYSSRGIITAVKDSLNNALSSGTIK